MKTKSLLMIAATLAATVITSQAQVYSQNIVGYVNVVFKGAANYTLVANPLDDGNGNSLTNLVNALPNKSTVLVWNGSGYTSSSKGSGVWSLNLPLTPGTGFFVKNGLAASPDVTNTFAGSVIVNSGLSVTNNLLTGYSLVGSPVPFGGDVTTDTNINIGATLANKSTILRWEPSTQNYQSTSKGSGVWSTPLNVGVGEGFYINNKTSTNWVQIAP